MRIAYLGAGVWGFCLASLLASKGYEVTSWTNKPDLADRLNSNQDHPFLPGQFPRPNMSFTTDLAEAIDQADIIIESVTSAGIRPVCEKLKELKIHNCPIVITSKGIEQNSGLILPEVVIQVLGESHRPNVGAISGPSFAQEVVRGLPTSVVGSAYDYQSMLYICDLFTTASFRVYPNADMLGVGYGGALKNIIAIACGISDGLALGNSSKAALMTRGLHEIRKLAGAKGCKEETLNGLSGLGDLCLTCSSLISRNYRFGHLLGQETSPEDAQIKIGMVVEGAYTCVSALQLSKQSGIAMPITETVNAIIYGHLSPMDAVKALMQRTIKEEHL